MTNSQADTLVRESMSHIAAGRRHIAIWGIDETALAVARSFEDSGVNSVCRTVLVDRLLDHVDRPPVHGCTLVGRRDLDTLPIDLLVIAADADKEQHLREFVTLNQRLPVVVLAGTEHFKYADPDFGEVLRNCLVKSYATGYTDSLVHLFQAVRYLGQKRLRGAVAEFGMFKGGTTEFLVRSLRRFSVDVTAVFGFDSFTGFPARRSLFDMYTNPDCEFTNAEAVCQHARSLDIEVIQGDICETIDRLKGVPLILSFFDTDNYSPTRAALELCYESTVEGGILAFDHYHSEDRFRYTLGERMAAHDVLGGKPIFHLQGTGIFLKI